MTPQSRESLEELLKFISTLEAKGIWYNLEHVRDAIMILLAVSGERWEVEFFPDGHVEVERFVSTGTISDETELQKLLNGLTL